MRLYSGAYFVNVYRADRAYGGGEEGGWWFDVGEFLKSRPCRTEREADQIAERWTRWLDRQNDAEGSKAELSSVCCTGRLVAYVEREPGADYPAERPFYE